MTLVVLLSLGALWFSARGAITICLLTIEDGQIAVAKGAISPRILADLRDVVRRPRVKNGSLRIVRSAGLASVEAEGGLTPEQLQQVRNIVGSVPLAKLANGKKAPA